MTHEQAHQILDRVKDGIAYPRIVIEAALWLTGDLDAHEAMRGEGMAKALPGQSQNRWGSARQFMVAKNNHGH